MGIKGSKMKKCYGQLKLGLKKQDVINLLGQPDSQKVRSGIEVLGWYSKEFKGMLRGGFLERTISVEFENDIVIGFDGENINASAW